MNLIDYPDPCGLLILIGLLCAIGSRMVLSARRRRCDTGHVSVHQCPYCELRFATRNEVEDHIAVDHPRAVDDDTFPAPHGESS